MISNAFYAKRCGSSRGIKTRVERQTTTSSHSCQTSLRKLLFHLVQRIRLHFKSPDLYLFCTTNWRSPVRSCYHLNLKQAFKVKNLVPMTIHHGGCHWSRALYQVAVAHAYAKKTPVPKIKVILSLFSSHNTNVPQRSSQAKTRQKRQWGRLQKSLSSVSSSIWPMWSTFLSVTDKTLIIHW